MEIAKTCCTDSVAHSLQLGGLRAVEQQEQQTDYLYAVIKNEGVRASVILSAWLPFANCSSTTTGSSDVLIFPVTGVSK